MTARIAQSLDILRRQVDEFFPKRSRISDGWIGDQAHASRKSDHNPNPVGVVQAIDLTHDPASGCDSYALAEALRMSKDSRIKYVISNGHIFSSTMDPWMWREYNGSNKHTKHVHVSVNDDPENYDDIRLWDLDGSDQIVDTTPEYEWRFDFAKKVLEWESARDAQGRLIVHRPSDSTFEVGGVWSQSHPQLANELLNLVNTGRHKEAEERVLKFIVEFTEPVRNWAKDPACEFFLRDSFYNRGSDGSARIFQMALGLKGKDVDGEVGPQTKKVYDQSDPNALLMNLRTSREMYEVQTYGRREKYWVGLTNRWNNAYRAAKDLKEKMMSMSTAPAPVVTEDHVLTEAEIRSIQERLRVLGRHEAGYIDGKWGPKTIGAIVAFEVSNGLPISVRQDPPGLSDRTTLALMRAQPDPIDPVRDATTADDLRNQGSTTVRRADKINIAQYFQWGMTFLTALVFTFQNYQSAEIPAVFRIALQFIPGVPPIVLPIVMGLITLYTKLKADGIISNRVLSERLGLHNGEAVRVASTPVLPAARTKPVETAFAFPFRRT